MALLALRADASPRLGVGHVMRSIALGQGWIDETGGKVVMISRDLPRSLMNRCHESGIQTIGLDCEDPLGTLRAISQLAPEVLAADGCHFDAPYLRALNASGVRILHVDDSGQLPEYESAFVLNQNFHASTAMYAHHGPVTKLLTGTSYALLRREFRHAPEFRPIATIAKRLLIMAGGSDPSNYSMELLNLTDGLERDVKVRIVTGPVNEHVAKVKAAIARSGLATELLQDVTDMRPLMEWADFALTAGGSTILELAAMRVPFAGFSHGIGEEQSLTAAERAGACQYFGPGSTLQARRSELMERLSNLFASSELRQQLASSARSAVDGRGVHRVVRELSQ